MSGAFPRTVPTSHTDSTDADFVFTLWTNDPALARRADDAGIDRVGVDLERLGKAERQRGRATWLSPHVEDDLAALRLVLRSAALFARVDPLNADSRRQIDVVIGQGTQVVMLPMVATPESVDVFVRLVDGRARVVLLIEQRSALEVLADLTAVPGVDEIHIGLNDLALSFAFSNRWLLFATDAIDRAAATAHRAGLRFGLGGVARVDDDTLPIPSDLVYAEHARTGSRAALVSRSFHGAPDLDLAADIASARARLGAWRAAPPCEVDRAHHELCARARALDRW